VITIADEVSEGKYAIGDFLPRSFYKNEGNLKIHDGEKDKIVDERQDII